MRFLIIFAAAALFFISGNLLHLLGWNYTSPSASLVEKIHPLFYIFAPAALLALAAGRMDPFFDKVKVKWSLGAYAIVVGLLLAVTLIRARYANIATGGEVGHVIVTLLMPALVFYALAWLRNGDFQALGVVLRIILVANSLVGLFEQVTHHLLLPRLQEGELIFKGWRSTGFLGHPLSSAAITGLMLVYLMVSDRGKFYRRIPEIALHALAMFSFGGRSALVNLVGIVLIRIVALIFQFAATGRARGIARYAVGALAATMLASAILPLSFVQNSLSRFTNDSGSAETRINAIRFLSELNYQSLLFGMDSAERNTQYLRYKLPTGIEIAWGTWTVTYGLIVTVLLMATLFTFLFRFAYKLEVSAKYMLIYFIAVTTTSLSIGSKSLLISQFLVMIASLCWVYGSDRHAVSPENTARTKPKPRIRTKFEPEHTE